MATTVPNPTHPAVTGSSFCCCYSAITTAVAIAAIAEATLVNLNVSEQLSVIAFVSGQ